MSDLWKKINDDITEYVSDICLDYNLKCERVSDLKTALLGDKFAIEFGINRFDVDVYYLYFDGNKIVKHSCGNFFARAFDDSDRKNLISGNGVDVIVRNCLKVTVSGLSSKWRNVLQGDTSWLKDYKKSPYYGMDKLSDEEKYVFETNFLSNNEL